MAISAPIVFISSTCYDLTDLRAELGEWLQKDGFIVKLSDNLDSGFSVDPSCDAIETCLRNLRKSDVVLFVLDRRYGSPLGGKYGDKSATHVEFDEAVTCSKRMFHFARRATWDEYRRWKSDPKSFSAPGWVDKGQFEALFRLMDEIEARGVSDWVDTFHASPDLRRIVTKRLYDVFPAQAGGRALTRDRVVRLHFLQFEVYGFDLSQQGPPVHCTVKNAGLSIAQNITAFVRVNGEKRQEKYESVLEPGSVSEEWVFTFGPEERGPGYEVVCEYGNLWGDRYEIRRGLVSDYRQGWKFGREEFAVIEAAC